MLGDKYEYKLIIRIIPPVSYKLSKENKIIKTINTPDSIHINTCLRGTIYMILLYEYYSSHLEITNILFIIY